MRKLEPDDFYPVALRKLFDGDIAGPLELSEEDIREARSWKRQLLAEICEIDASLDINGL